MKRGRYSSIAKVLVLALCVTVYGFADDVPQSPTSSMAKRFRELDLDRDGKLTPKEFRRPILFARMDTNKDGAITLKEAEAFFEKQSAKPKVSMKVALDVPYAKLKGVDQNLLSLDVYSPKEGKDHPVLVMIHGGGWQKGDKANSGVVEPKSTFFVDRGFVFVSVNYRLSPKVQHPAHVQDVAKALAFVHDNAKKFGGDPDRMFVMGHSAGAHLAALVAVDERRLKAEGKDLTIIKGLIPLDTAAYDLPRLMKEFTLPARGRAMYESAFGKDETGWRDASPRAFVAKKKELPPFLIFHTPRLTAKTLSEDLAKALKEAGTSAEVHAVQKTHAAINRDIGNKDDKVTQRILKFLNRFPARSK